MGKKKTKKKDNCGCAHWYPQYWIRKMYDWVVHWAKTKYAQLALFLLAFAESSFFPVPPDVLLIAMGVSVPKKALRFGAICLAGSVMGGVAGYFIGLGAWNLVGDFFFAYVPNFTPELFDKVSNFYKENAFVAVFTAGFTPIPYKIFTIAAGVAQINLGEFIIASIFSRGLRFFIVAGALRIFGAKVQTIINKYFDLLTIIFTILFVGGFIAIKFFSN